MRQRHAMTSIEDVSNKIREYSARFRNPDLEQICRGEIYCLKKESSDSPELGWPDTWPQANRRGVYAIVSDDRVLYIGKASQQPIGHRLSSYFRYGEARECTTVAGHNWTHDPTHVVTWAVPDSSPFEASSLEEYLIIELKPCDNTAGKRA